MIRGGIQGGREGERGVVIILVAVVLLFIIAAVAALAIDLVTFYTARSEAQIAADGAALAGARVLANSGMTSDPNAVPDGLMGNAEVLARLVATRVASNNQVGGKTLNSLGTCTPGAEISICFPNDSTDPTFVTNPRITVQVTRNDLPTFFARIWGRSAVTVSATATAEAYNPSGMSALGTTIPVAPSCVKPWVLPNMSLNDLTGATPIFTSTGAIQDTALLGKQDVSGRFRSRCGGCANPAGLAPQVWRFYPADPSSFPPPNQSLPSCNVSLTPYQNSIAGCVTTPIVCGTTVNLAQSTATNLHLQASQAVNCLTHALNNKGDQIDVTLMTSPPFQFLAGDDNPVVSARGTDVLVSDSLATVPVYNNTGGAPGSNPVTIVGFVQLFLNPDGRSAPPPPGPGIFPGVNTTVVNLVGCGIGATGTPILGNGSSAVPVRLVTTP